MADKDKPKAKAGEAKAGEAKAKEQAPKGRLKAVPPAEWPPLIGLTVDEAAAALRTDDKTVRKLIQSGAIPYRVVGRAYRIDPEGLRQWLASGHGPSRAELAAAEVEEYLNSSEGIGEPPHIDHSKP